MTTRQNKHLLRVLLAFVGLGFSLALARADCPDFSGNYTRIFPQANYTTKFTVTQKGCTELDTRKDDGDGAVSTRVIILDGLPHMTYQDGSEVITESFTLSDGVISYLATDNYSWGERFVNEGSITQDSNGNWVEQYSQSRWDGTYLYTTKLVFSKNRI